MSGRLALRRIGWLAVFCAAPLLAASDETPVPPVPLRVVAPVHQLFHQPGPVATASPGRGVWRWTVQLSESNVLHPPSRAETKAYEAELDLEITRITLGVELGLTDRWTIHAELPLQSLHSGFLDSFVHEFEEAVGKVKPRRRNEVRGRYAFRAARAGVDFFDVSSGDLEIGDLALVGRRHLRRVDGYRPGVATFAGVKLPSGDRRRATGSGRVELVAGVAVDWLRGPWSLAAGGSLTLPLGDVANTPGLDALPMAGGWGEISRPLGGRAQIHFQAAGSTGPFDLDGRERAGGDTADLRPWTDHVLQATLAGSWSLGAARRLYVGWVEDFESDNAAADVTLFVALVWSAGAGDRYR